MKWLFAEWDSGKQTILDSIRLGLERMGHTVESFSRSDTEKRANLCAAIRSGEFDALLTWQRFYSMQQDVIDTIRESGLRTVFTDYGFKPHYETVVFDTCGENATSSWPSAWSTAAMDTLAATDLAEAEELLRAEAARASTMDRPDPLPRAAARAPFVFVPLQRPRDAVVRFDSEVHDFGHLLRRVLFLSRGRFLVVCKTHPHDRDMELGVPDVIPNSHIVLREGVGRRNEEVCDYLLSRAALVVGVNSNMLFRALLFNTPVIATGRSWFSGANVLEEVEGADGLRELSASLPGLTELRRCVAKCLTRQLHRDSLDNPEQLRTMLMRLDPALVDSEPPGQNTSAAS